MEKGTYIIKVALTDDSGGIRNIIKTGMAEELTDEEGFITTGTLKISK